MKIDVAGVGEVTEKGGRGYGNACGEENRLRSGGGG